MEPKLTAMKQSVKTDQQAIDIISRNLIDIDGAIEQTIYPTDGRCACGETKAFQGVCEDGTACLKVNVCDKCGDEAAFDSDVLEIK